MSTLCAKPHPPAHQSALVLNPVHLSFVSLTGVPFANADSDNAKAIRSLFSFG